MPWPQSIPPNVCISVCITGTRSQLVVTARAGRQLIPPLTHGQVGEDLHEKKQCLANCGAWGAPAGLQAGGQRSTGVARRCAGSLPNNMCRLP